MKRIAILVNLLVALLVSNVLAQTNLRLAWWGGDARHEMYNALADMYEQQNPDIKLDREFAGWGPYWERLATQTAGGNAPDILHMHQLNLEQYAGRGALLDLTPLVESGEIDLSDFSQAIIDSGTLGDHIYMITLGNSAPGTHYNERLFAEAGVAAPSFEWSWDDFVSTATTLSDALGPDIYGVNDTGGWNETLNLYMRQQGKKLFEGDALGFSKEDLIAYWSIWEELREAGAIPPADMTAEFEGASHADSLLARGIVAMQLASGNQHKLYQAVTEDPLGLTSLPRSNDSQAPYGDTVGGAYISLSSETEHPEEAAAFINWFINDLEVATMYNFEHGPPGSVVIQDTLGGDLDPADVRLANLMQFYSQSLQAPDPIPAASAEVFAAFSRIYQELAFGQFASVEEAVDAFFEEVDFILN